MKSIMHEASSIAKAIEQGWDKAGQPTDFSVKILEKPQKNFFGLTTHPAKVAIYFDERPAQRSELHPSRQAHKPREMREPRQDHRTSPQPQRRPVESRPLETRSEHQRYEQRPVEPRRTEHHEPRAEVSEQSSHARTSDRQPQEQGNLHRQEAQWNEAMIAYAREWLDTVLPESAGKHVGFTIEPNNLYLRITFEAPVLENQEKEKRLFASISLLILEALKRKFKVGLRKHKIILTHGHP